MKTLATYLFLFAYGVKSFSAEMCQSEGDYFSFFSKPTCEEILESEYPCDKDNSYDPEIWYPNSIKEKINSLNKIWNTKLDPFSKSSNFLLNNEEVRSCMIDKLEEKHSFKNYDQLELKGLEGLAKLQRIISDSSLINYGMSFPFFITSNRIIANHKEQSKENLSEQNYCFQNSKFKQINESNKGEVISFSELREILKESKIDNLYPSKNYPSKVTVDSHSISYLCQFTDDVNVVDRLKYTYLKNYNNYSQDLKKPLKELRENDEIESTSNSILNANLHFYFNSCVYNKVLSPLAKEILHGEDMKASKIKASKAYKRYIDIFLGSLTKEWSFELPYTGFNTINSILSNIGDNPLSSESKETLMEVAKKYTSLTYDLDEEFTKTNYDFESINGAHWYSGRVSLDVSSVLYGAKNPLALEVLIAHEIAHFYTIGLDGNLFYHKKLSSESQKYMKSNYGFCLYGDKEKKAKNGYDEDLADTLGNIYFNLLNPELTRNDVDSIINFYCHLTKGREVRSTHGHSGRKDRAYRFIKYSKSAQNLLGCRIKEPVCQIKFK